MNTVTRLVHSMRTTGPPPANNSPALQTIRIPLGPGSTPAVPDSAWCSDSFMLGAGMVLIQENTHKIVVVYDSRHKKWFFPRGRKDVGESVEQAALREAYEESGYEPYLFPHFGPCHAPLPPTMDPRSRGPWYEPIFITLGFWRPGSRKRLNHGGEYLTTWYLGGIEEDAVRKLDTGMPDEKDYESHLLDYEDALTKVYGQEVPLLKYAWEIYRDSMQTYMELDAQERQGEQLASDEVG